MTTMTCGFYTVENDPSQTTYYVHESGEVWVVATDDLRALPFRVLALPNGAEKLDCDLAQAHDLIQSIEAERSDPLATGRRIGQAMARDAKAEGMPLVWTGLDDQDGDQATAAGIEPGTKEWEQMESSAKAAFLGAI